jgi:hypothetical protein
MSDRLAVHMDDLHRLSRAFGSAASNLAALGRTVDTTGHASSSAFGQGQQGRSASEAYAHMRTQLSESCAQLSALTARTGHALRDAAQRYDEVQTGIIHQVATRFVTGER